MTASSVLPGSAHSTYIRLSLSGGLMAEDLATILHSIHLLHGYIAALEPLHEFGVDAARLLTNTIWLHSPFDPAIEAPITLYDYVRGYPAALRRSSAAPTIRRAQFSSPGLFSIEGSAALGKIVDILHKGELEKEQIAALTRRIEAESDLLTAQVVEKQLQNVASAISIMMSVGFTEEQVRTWLRSDARLIQLLGAPLKELQGFQERQLLTDVVTESE